MSKKNNLYLGKAGQFLVMSQFLVKGWNVAIPEVDVGDDIFVVKDESGEFSRVQVKTSTGKKTKYGFSAQFNIPIVQLEFPFTPKLTYVFVVYFGKTWQKMVVIERKELYKQFLENNVGTVFNDKLKLYLQYREEDLICNGQNWTTFHNNLDNWPTIIH